MFRLFARAATYAGRHTLEALQTGGRHLYRNMSWLARGMKECLQTLARGMYRAATFTGKHAWETIETVSRNIYRALKWVARLAKEKLQDLSLPLWIALSYAGAQFAEAMETAGRKLYRGGAWLAREIRECFETLARSLFRAAAFAGTDQAPATVTAFEMKLSDWRRALRQAYRYSYFSDRTIVVLPAKGGQSAKQALPLFKDLGIGLWVFKRDLGTISKVFTPRAKRPKNPAARERALEVLRRKFNLGGARK